MNPRLSRVQTKWCRYQRPNQGTLYYVGKSLIDFLLKILLSELHVQITFAKIHFVGQGIFLTYKKYMCCSIQRHTCAAVYMYLVITYFVGGYQHALKPLI